MPAEDRASCLDLAYDLAHRARDVQASPLGVGAGLAAAAAEPARAVQLVREHLHLLAQPCRPADVVQVLGLLELVAQLAEPRLVGATGIGVEHLPGVAGAQVLGTAEIERVELVTGMTEQLQEVIESLGI